MKRPQEKSSGRWTRRRVLASALGAASVTGLVPGSTVWATDLALKIVSVGGSITEIVVALGHGRVLVGIDTTSVHPPQIQSLPRVGYMRTLSPEGVLSLGPDIVVATERAGPETTVSQLTAAGILRLVPDRPTVDGIREKILAVGEAIGAVPEAKDLADMVAADLEAARRDTAKIKERPRVAFLHNIGRAAPIAGGRGTPPDVMISFAGGINAFQEFDDYKPVSPEAVITAAPDIVLMTPGSIESFGGLESVFALPHVVGTPAGDNKAVRPIDGLYTLGFGPRTAHAILDLARVLHPERQFITLPQRKWV